MSYTADYFTSHQSDSHVVKRNQEGANLVMVLATDESNGSEALVVGRKLNQCTSYKASVSEFLWARH